MRGEEWKDLRTWDSVHLRNGLNSQAMSKVLVSKEVAFIQRKETKRMNLNLET